MSSPSNPQSADLIAIIMSSVQSQALRVPSMLRAEKHGHHSICSIVVAVIISALQKKTAMFKTLVEHA